MATTSSTLIPLGSIAPEFTLFDTVSGNNLSLQDLKSEKATVIMFICNHCPFVVHINKELVKLSKEYIHKGVSFIAISSNDIENYPADAPDKMAENAKKEGYPFPYLYDDTQEVAKNYAAVATPDFYIFDKDLKCKYRGQLDDSRPSNKIVVTGVDMRNALDNILNDKEVSEFQKPSIGCSIKWKRTANK